MANLVKSDDIVSSGFSDDIVWSCFSDNIVSSCFSVYIVLFGFSDDVISSCFSDDVVAFWVLHCIECSVAVFTVDMSRVIGWHSECCIVINAVLPCLQWI